MRELKEEFEWQAIKSTKKMIGLSQRCPTHSPLATCGEWLF